MRLNSVANPMSSPSLTAERPGQTTANGRELDWPHSTVAEDVQRRNTTRSARAKTHAVGSLFCKGLSIASNFVVVRLAIAYVNPAVYGIWLTLYSVLSWTQLLDIGLGNGLRNKFAEALARHDHVLAKRYVSTAYAVLFTILATALIAFLIVSPFVDWAIVFNAPEAMREELHSAVRLVFAFLTLRFLLKLIGCVLTADQRPAVTSLLGVASSVITLVALVIASNTVRGSLFGLAAICSSAPAFVFLVASIFFYFGKYKAFAPSPWHVDWAMARGLTGLGLRFFVVQIAYLVMYCTSNIIITHLEGPGEVTVYNVAYMYFSVTVVIFGVLMSPVWSATTDAFVHGDLAWIRRTTRSLLWLFVGVVAVIIAMFLGAQPFYKFWMGTTVNVPTTLSAVMALYAILLNWAGIFSNLINGMGKIRLSVRLATCGAVLNIPLSIFLARTVGLGSSGVVLATCMCLAPACIVLPIQYWRILNGSAAGIWAR